MKRFSGSAIPRHQVFTLADGSYVVQWDDKQVQEILSGDYRPYEHKIDFGHEVTDYELKQLKLAGRVEYYNRSFVWLYALPERGRVRAKTLDRGGRVRVYYLNTSLPRDKLAHIQSLLESIGFAEEFIARGRDNTIVILGKNGIPFRNVRQAEVAQHKLQTQEKQVFRQLSIAFIETKQAEQQRQPVGLNLNGGNLDLDELIASQGDTSVTEGKVVILAMQQKDEREAFRKLLADDMHLRIFLAENGEEVVYLVEDHRVDLLVMDINQPDMHGYKLFGMLKERINLAALPIVAVMEDQTVVPLKNVTCVVRPISMASLRHTVWTMLKNAKNSSPE